MARAKKWTRDAIIAQIQERYRTGGNKALRTINIQSWNLHFYRVAGAEFGSWREAVEAAGFDYEAVLDQKQCPRNCKWSKEAVAARIQARKREKLSLWAKEVNKDEPGLMWAARTYFVNGWDEARNFAGVPCEHQPRTIAADLAASRHPTIWTWVPPEELFRRKVVPAKPTSPWDLFAQAAETVHPTMRNVVTVAKAADVMPGVFQEFIYGNREFVKKYQVQYER